LKDAVAAQVQTLNMWTRIVVRVILILFAIALAIWIFYALRSVLLLLVLSVFFCYLIAPIVRLFEQPVYVAGRELALPRGVAILVVYILFGVVLFLAAQSILPLLGQQLSEMGKEMPTYISKGTASGRKWLEGADSWLRRLRLPAQYQDELLKRGSEAAEAIFSWVRDGLLGLLGYLFYIPWLVLVPILSFFMLKDADKFAKEVVSLMPTQRLQRRANRLLLDVSSTLAAYIRAQLTACVWVGVAATVGFIVIGVNYAVVLGIFAGVMEFIPMVGPLIAIVVAFLLALTSSFKTALLVLLFLICLRLVEDYVIYPRIVGHGIKMHPLVVVIAILCGAEVDGVVGIFLAIPVVGLLIVGYNHYLAYRRTLLTGIGTGDLVMPPDRRED
jgi:predicted PurR-regulated permease PerM